jgi:hypothetical protein
VLVRQTQYAKGFAGSTLFARNASIQAACIFRRL